MEPIFWGNLTLNACLYSECNSLLQVWQELKKQILLPEMQGIGVAANN